MHDAGAGPALAKGIEVKLIIQEAQILRTGAFERRDVAEFARGIGTAVQASAGARGEFGQRERPMRFEKARVRHRSISWAPGPVRPAFEVAPPAWRWRRPLPMAASD